MLEINEFRCYEAKIEESEKVGSHQESNPGHLWLEPNGVLTVHAEWFARCATEAFSTTSAVNIEDCEGWWLSGCCMWLSCRALVAQAGGVRGSTPGDCRLFSLPHNI